MDLQEKGLAHESQGALVVDVATGRAIPKKSLHVLSANQMVLHLYATSDLATIIQREQDYHPDQILYVADNRQSMHFTQVFRAAKKAGLW